jgi:hypothetical protein
VHATLFGAGDEYFQSFVPGRDSSVYDWMADTSGVVLAQLVYVFAVTQLSHSLLNNMTVEGALQTALLLGMVWLVLSGAWPPSAMMLCVTNDFIWWIPFGVYLHDAWPAFRRDA